MQNGLDIKLCVLTLKNGILSNLCIIEGISTGGGEGGGVCVRERGERGGQAVLLSLMPGAAMKSLDNTHRNTPFLGATCGTKQW